MGGHINHKTLLGKDHKTTKHGRKKEGLYTKILQYFTKDLGNLNSDTFSYTVYDLWIRRISL